MTNSNKIVNKLKAMGLQVWDKNGKKRIYMSCAQYNEITGCNYSLNNQKNKIFYDFEANAIMRSYKNKKPSIEHQY